MSSSTALFEFSEPDGNKKWVAKPGRQTAFPLSIRNQTGEGHDVAVCVEEPANWAWAMPQRISLDPGDAATVNIVFSPSRETTVAAGEHRAAIRLRDLEGVIFAECTHSFDVEERQELAMTVTLRGPLMTFGQAEGFVLHCSLANRGNVDVTVTPAGDPHPSLHFSNRTVSVPFQGEVSFDIEVRWNASRRSNHPDTVILRAPYRDGEASASIEWRYIAEALEPFMPIYSTAEEEDELLSLSWMQQPEAHAFHEHDNDYVELDRDSSEQRLPLDEPQSAAAQPVVPAPANVQSAGANGATSAEANAPIKRPPPIRFLKPREVQYTYGRRLNPWWPIVQKSAGRWRVKPLPILMLVIAMEGIIIGLQQSQHDAFMSAARGKIAPVTHALRFVPDTAAAIVGFGRRAVLVTLHGAHPLRHATAAHAPAIVATSAPARRAAVVKRHQIKPVRRATPRPKPTVVAARPTPTRPPVVATRKPNLAGSIPPSISALSARYMAPSTIEVTFVNHGLSNVQLTVADGAKVIYRAPQVVSHTLTLKVPRRWYHPLQISLVGSAPGGVVMQRHVWLWKPGLK